MGIGRIVTTTVLLLALITISTTTAAAISCDCGDICVNETGWWRDGGAFTASTTPIQAAVDNAGSGENVDIAISHLTLAGEGADVVTVTAALTLDHVFEVTADYVNISGFNATGATDSKYAGIYLYGVDHCNISENTASNNYYGISLKSSSNNTLASNNASSNNKNGIYLYSSSNNNTLASNTANSNTNYGIYLYSSSNNTLASNNANSNTIYGIHLQYSSSNTLASNNANNNSNGIFLWSSSNNTLASNNASSNDYFGIRLQSSSSNNTLTSNTASSNNLYGIYLYSSSDNTLTSNIASSNNNYGIYLYSSSNYNTLTCNTANTNSQYGIYLWSSSNNTLASNTASNNYIGIRLYDSSNNNTLASNTASSNYYGIYLTYSSNNNTLTNNTASNNNDGIRLYDSSNNMLASNTARSNKYNGIRLYDSSNNMLASNTASNNNYGIFMCDSSNNTLTSNTVSNNNYGIRMQYSSSNNNLIYNNYFNNTNNANDDGSNQWNITKTSETNIIGGPYLGGNYWSDYTGVDNDDDGLGDTMLPYNSSGNIQNGGDYHPLVVPTDTTPPVITIMTPMPYELYIMGTTLDFSATDDESGVATIFGNLTNTSEVSHIVDSGFALEVGVYTLVVTATDNAGNTNESDPVFFVVYDPDGGFATGGGWFYPDSDSTLPDGRANFGFTAKYKDDSSTGKLNFQSRDANIKLKSTSIDWLTISAVSAQFQGTGTINGEGLYTFRVQVKDNGEPGVDVDHFDIKIWNGTDTEADPYHKAKNTISGGNIQVHTK